MSKPLQVGITGSIGSGKSFVSDIFSKLNIPVYDADVRAKWVMANDPMLKESLVAEFGTQTYYDSGLLNREHISSIVYNNKSKLEKLNGLVHPRVAADYENWVNQHEEHSYVLKEAALLFEADSYKVLDKIITVSAPESLRMLRVLARDNHRTEEEVRRIMAQQLPDSEKIARADYVITNDEQKMLLPQVIHLHGKLKSHF